MTGKELKAIRKKLALTQQALADLLGVHKVTIAKREGGALEIGKEAELAIRFLDRAKKKTDDHDHVLVGDRCSCGFPFGSVVFESGSDLIDVTSLHRPDVEWSYIDRQQHRHVWYVLGQPALAYKPDETYSVPSLAWIDDGVRYDEDGKPYYVGHNECRVCGEHIEPGYTADATTVYAPGLMWYRIDGVDVSREEWEAALKNKSLTGM